MKAFSKEKEIHYLRQKLLTMASHEFKTPLAFLQTQLDILKAWEKEEEKSERHLHLFGKMQKQLDSSGRSDERHRGLGPGHSTEKILSIRSHSSGQP
jgi:signal transduction histidine kinase